MKHIVFFSFGIGSWAAAKRVVEKHGTNETILLNCDTKIEDEDTYKWGKAAAENVGAKLVTIEDGRDPWEVFFDVRMMGSTQHDPCSRVLKRQLRDQWLNANFTPENCICYIGIHWTEEDRYRTIKLRMAPWQVEAPLCEKPLIGYMDLHDWAKREGLWTQRLYQMGFPHANCGGFCVKAGQAHFRRLLEVMPERYAYHERREQEFREFIGKDVAIMRDRKGGKTTPLTMADFRKRVESGEQGCFEDWGGCNCFGGVE